MQRTEQTWGYNLQRGNVLDMATALSLSIRSCHKTSMKTTLEIFYVRIIGKQVRYRRKEVNLNRKGSDPDALIWSRIRQGHSDPHPQDEEHEFIVHSTSWRCERPGKIILTYVAYSDELEFEKGKWKRLPLKSLRTITKKSHKPPSRAEVEKRVVSHAMRHLAFLVQTEKQAEFERALNAETIKAFEKLWVSLAGQVFEQNGK